MGPKKKARPSNEEVRRGGTALLTLVLAVEAAEAAINTIKQNPLRVDLYPAILGTAHPDLVNAEKAVDASCVKCPDGYLGLVYELKVELGLCSMNFNEFSRRVAETNLIALDGPGIPDEQVLDAAGEENAGNVNEGVAGAGEAKASPTY